VREWILKQIEILDLNALESSVFFLRKFLWEEYILPQVHPSKSPKSINRLSQKHKSTITLHPQSKQFKGTIHSD
jgi:hypothetical protein